MATELPQRSQRCRRCCLLSTLAVSIKFKSRQVPETAWLEVVGHRAPATCSRGIGWSGRRMGRQHVRSPLRAAAEPLAVGEALVLASVASVGALAAWLLVRRTRSSSRALDPGREELITEYFAPGRKILELPLDNGGTLQVTGHKASESQAPPGAPAGSFQEWRCLRFLRSGGLIQSVTKVVVYPNDDQLPRIQGHVVPLAYTKSFATVVLAALSAMGAPVLPRKAMKAKEPLRILCIGLGGGTVPSFYAESLPHCQVDVVELEPAVVHAAKEGMGFREWPNLKVFLEDGVTFAQNKVQEGAADVGVYDAVLVDAYDPDGNVPEALWSRGEGLVEALSNGLLRRCGVVATNFLPHVDLAAPLAAYSGALSSHGSGRSFSIQVNKPVDPENDLEKIFDVEGTGNRIAVHICGAPPELAEGPLSALEDRLKAEAKKVGMATGCVWDMPDLACRGLRDWPAVQAADEVKIFSM